MTNSLPPYTEPGFSGWIGVARVDITPPVGIYARNWGAATHDVAEGIHRPLQATALTLQSSPDEPPCVLIAYDLGWWKTTEDEWHLRGGVIEALGLDPARVIMKLSHTHAGPAISREDKDAPGGELIAAYMDMVRERLIEVSKAALASHQPATLTRAGGRCGMARNRDLRDPDKPRLVCGFNPEPPADDALLVGRATDANGNVIAVLANYACHPTTLAWPNKVISPDFVGAFNETVEKNIGGLSLFLQGASGELQAKEIYTDDLAVPEKHGRTLGYAVLSLVEGMLPPGQQLEYTGVVESGAPLATWGYAPSSPSTALRARQLEVAIPLKADLPTVAEIETQLAATTDRALAERLVRKRRVRCIVGDEPVFKCPVWVWQIGDAVLVTQMNEAYSKLQSSLRLRHPARPVLVMNLSNGSCGYLPPREHYDEDIYQVWQTPYERGCLELMIEATDAALSDIVS